MTDDKASEIDFPAQRFTPEVDATMQDTVKLLELSDDVDETMLRVTSLICTMFDGCTFSSISMLDGESIRTVGSTDERAEAVDQIQYETREGPCWVAATEPKLLVYTSNNADDSRWPAFSRRTADEVGVFSLMACRLVVGDPPKALGALNIYGGEPGAFDNSDHQVAMLMAAVTALLLEATQRQVHLVTALESRGVIGQAMGILMAQSDVSADDAFEQLKAASQRMNIKLRDLARTIAESTGGKHQD